MADFDSSLPIRTEAAGDVDVFISDASTPSQKLKVNSDGSIDVNSSLPVGTKVEITDGTDDLAINADGSLNAVVSATDLDIRDLDAGQDSVAAHLKDADGNAFSASNPLPVEFFEAAEELYSYSEGSAIAANASSEHEYTTTDEFKLKEVMASGSGKMRAELQIETAAASGVFNTVMVKFNSTANPNILFTFQKGLNVASGAKVKLVRTNLDKQAQNLYSAIIGINV
jgi:hypothetical protein